MLQNSHIHQSLVQDHVNFVNKQYYEQQRERKYPEFDRDGTKFQRICTDR